MARRLGPSSALKGVSMATSIGAKAVLKDVIRSSPIAEAAVAAACERNASGIARIRNGMLYSTGGFLTDAGGTIAAAGRRLLGHRRQTSPSGRHRRHWPGSASPRAGGVAPTPIAHPQLARMPHASGSLTRSGPLDLRIALKIPIDYSIPEN